MTLPTIELLERIAETHDQSVGFNPQLIACRARALASELAPGMVLELGCGDGLLTRALAEHHTQVVAVDASATRVERTRKATRGLPADIYQSHVGHFEPPGDMRFDAVILSCVLDHLAGVHMGLLPDLDALDERACALGARRTYTLDSLRGELEAAGLRVRSTGGILFKPLPSSRMCELPAAVIDAYEALGRELPDLAAEIYAIGVRH
jgi:SAM-dependent methyltransferase